MPIQDSIGQELDHISDGVLLVGLNGPSWLIKQIDLVPICLLFPMHQRIRNCLILAHWFDSLIKISAMANLAMS